LSPYQSALLREFVDSNVSFLVIGAFALQFLGRTRPTEDLDLLVSREASNAEKIYSILVSRVPASATDRLKSFLMAKGKRIPIPLGDHEVDVLTSIGTLDFARSWSESTHQTLGGVAVRVPRIIDLIHMKWVAQCANEDPKARERDAQDLDWLLALLHPATPAGHERDKERDRD